MAIPVAATELAGTFLETLGYGIYLVIFPRCLLTLRRKNVSGGLMAYLLGTMLISFALITLHLIVDLIRVFTAFTAHMDVGNAAVEFYTIVDTPLNLTKNVSYCTATLVADALLVYRTFVIWGHQYWILIVPVILYCFVIAMSLWYTWSLTQAQENNSVFVSAAFFRSKYFYAATFSLNILCTGLIAFKIWKIQRSVSEYYTRPRHGGAGRALSIILESALIYSAALICLIGTSVSDNSAMFLFITPMPSLIGSVFSYVVLRSSTDSERIATTGAISSGVNHEISFRKATHRSRMSMDNDMGSSPPDGVHVHLEHIVHHDLENSTKQGLDKRSVDTFAM